MEGSSEQNLSCLLSTKFSVRSFQKEHLNKPDAFWKQVMWTEEVQIFMFGEEKRVQNFMKRTQGVDQSCFDTVLQ